MDWVAWLKEHSFNSNNIWVIYIFLIVFATLFINYLELIFFKRLMKRLEQTKSIWDDAFAWAIHKPLNVFIWLYGLSFAAQAAEVPFAPWLGVIRRVGFVLLVAWFFIRFANKFDENFSTNGESDESKLDKGTVHALSRLFKIAVIITSALLIMEILKINIGPILALGGAGTVILGIAAQDLLANFFGALIIHLDRPFFIGDWIRSPDRSIEGTVEHIGWRMTRIRTFDKRPLYVPNSIFTKISVENPSRMSNRRIKEVVGVRYRDVKQVEQITADIKQMLLTHPEIDAEKACFVNLNGFGPSSLDILIYTFTKTTLWIPFQGIKQDIMLRILTIIEQHGAEVAFPTTTVDVPEGIPQFKSQLQK